MNKNNCKWAGIFSGILFTLFTLLALVINNGYYYLTGGISGILTKFIPYPEHYESSWSGYDSLYDLYNKKVDMLYTMIFGILSIVIIVLIVALFIGKRNLFILIPTAVITFSALVNSFICLIDMLSSTIRLVINTIKTNSFESWMLYDVLECVMLLIFPIVMILFAVIVLLNTSEKLRLKSKWTRKLGFLPGALWIVFYFIYSISWFVLEFLVFNVPMSAVDLIDFFKPDVVNYIFGLALLFMGIWVTAGKKNITETEEANISQQITDLTE